MNVKFIVFLIGTLFIVFHFINKLAWSYPWPISDFYRPHRVTGTLGEYRAGPPVHFHEGVDIGETGGVYAIDSGTAQYLYKDGKFQGIGVLNKKYIHITAMVPNGSQVQGIIGSTIHNPPTQLGVVTGTHLHLEESGGSFNPLRSDGGLDGYNDYAVPNCVDGSVRVWREVGIGIPDDQNPQITNGILSGDIDISARMKDFYTAANGMSGGVDTRTGIYEISYEIFDKSGEKVAGPFTTKRFSSVPDDSAIGYTFRNWTAFPLDIDYWVTNPVSFPPPPGDGAFDTKGVADGSGYSIRVTGEGHKGEFVQYISFWIICGQHPTPDYSIFTNRHRG